MGSAIDSYWTIKTPSRFELRDRNSLFVGFTFRVETTEDVEAGLQMVKKQEHSASHYCYAYAIGDKNIRVRVSDDGEPSGTGGYPINNQIERRELRNVLVVVARYFGGTKLGTGGLVRAYGGTADHALSLSERVLLYRTTRLEIAYPYQDTKVVERLLAERGATIIDQDFTDSVKTVVEVRKSLADRLAVQLSEITQAKVTFHD